MGGGDGGVDPEVPASHDDRGEFPRHHELDRHRSRKRETDGSIVVGRSVRLGLEAEQEGVADVAGRQTTRLDHGEIALRDPHQSQRSDSVPVAGVVVVIKNWRGNRRGRCDKRCAENECNPSSPHWRSPLMDERFDLAIEVSTPQRNVLSHGARPSISRLPSRMPLATGRGNRATGRTGEIPPHGALWSTVRVPISCKIFQFGQNRRD